MRALPEKAIDDQTVDMEAALEAVAHLLAPPPTAATAPLACLNSRAGMGA